MGRGRPPKPGTIEEKAAARRERVRNNVRALRERRKRESALAKDTGASTDLQVERSVDNDVEPTNGHTPDHGLQSDSNSCRPDLLRSSTSGFSASDHQGGLRLIARRNKVPVMFPASVDMKGPYAAALLATVREQFLPDSVYLPPAINATEGKPWESKQYLWTPCAFWVTSAFTKASNQETSLLKTALLSIGMLMKSIQFQDTSLKVASLEMYRRCLQGIRKSLEPLAGIGAKSNRPKDTVSLYLSCHAAAMYELIQSPDLSATMHHLRGVSELICHLGDDRDQDGQSIAWLLLQDYRFAEMGLCLKFRYVSFSSVKRQQFEDATFGKLDLATRHQDAHGHRSHNMLVIVTDIADDISAIMVQVDALRHHLDRPDALMRLRRMLGKLDFIWHGFRHLYDKLDAQYGSAFVYEDIEAEGPGLNSLKFKTFDIGAAWCYNLMTQAYCLETSIDITALALQVTLDQSSDASSAAQSNTPSSDDDVPENVDDFVSRERLHELRRLHRAISIQLTQCLQYFLHTDKGITGQALAVFPLDAAFSMLEAELGRLREDLADAQNDGSTSEKVNMIKRDITSISEADKFCRKMQDRAKAFGLPAFHSAATAGAETAEPATSYTSYGTLTGS